MVLNQGRFCSPHPGCPGKTANSTSGPSGKEPGYSAGDIWDSGSIPGLGRSPGKGNSNLLSILAGRNPLTTRERDRLWFIGFQRVRHNWSIGMQAYTNILIVMTWGIGCMILAPNDLIYGKYILGLCPWFLAHSSKTLGIPGWSVPLLAY